MKTFIVLLFVILSLTIFVPIAVADFTLTTPLSSINEDQEIEATINLSIRNQGNTVYYLEGAFKKEGSDRYFGLTWNDTQWVKYISSDNFQSLKSITTNPEGTYSGILKVKLDTSSSQFTGSGNYILRINRFTSSGSLTPSDNQIILAVTAFPTSTPTPTPTPPPDPTATPTSTSITTPTNTPIPTTKPTSKPTVKPTTKPTSKPTTSNSTLSKEESVANPPASILGVNITETQTNSSSPSALTKSENSSPTQGIIFLGGGIIFILLAVFAFTFIVKKGSNTYNT